MSNDLNGAAVYKVRPILDVPRYEGFGSGDQPSLMGKRSLDEDFDPVWTGPEWEPPRLADIWKPFTAAGRVRPFNDYPCVDMFIPAFSMRAVETLRDILEANGELLSIESPIGTYYAYNVTTVIEALDLERSDMSRFDDGRISSIDRYEFIPGRLRGATIFRMREYLTIDTYVTNSFVRRVKEAGLKGFEFIKVWPLPPEVDYMLLHRQEWIARERSELPPGQKYKGNSVLIGLALDGDRPTAEERRRVDGLMDELDAILVDMHSDAPVVGSLEENEYVDGECWLRLSCPDAHALVDKLRPWLRQLDWPNGYEVIKAYGEYYSEELEGEYVEDI